MSQHLRHDCAWAAAQELLNVVAPALRPEEHRDFFDEALRVCQEMLTRFEALLARERQRLGRPSAN